MAVTLFAAIDVGSYEVEMKIFEFTARRGMKEIDQLRYRIELGKDTYNTGKIGVKKLEELCRVLNDFVRVMDGYGVTAYRACATSAVREAKNRHLIVEYVKRMTGLVIESLDNTQQHFLDYKAISFGLPDFHQNIQNGTAIADVGSGSVQISLFENDKMVTTQNIRIGNLRLREQVANLARNTVHLEDLLEELIDNELASFKKLYLKDKAIKNLVVAGGFISELLKKQSITATEYQELYERIVHKNPQEVAKTYGIPSDSASLILPSVTIFKRLIEEIGAEIIWMPGQDLSDGIAYDYAQKQKLLRMEHTFRDDIIASARNIAKRYQCNKNHSRSLENLALSIFDKMKKVSGMGERERLLLEIAVILQDCGKYINLSEGEECSYNIIMATEIIGLSMKERCMIANVVRYQKRDVSWEEVTTQNGCQEEEYLLITKLTAILRVAGAVNRSYRQKFENVRLMLKEQELILTVDTQMDITLEKGMFPVKVDYFEEVFHIRPVIRQKKNR